MTTFRTKMNRPKNFNINSLALALVLLTLVGCGSVEHKLDLQSNYLPVAGTKIEVGKVTNETGQSFDINIEQMLTDALAEKLRDENLLWTGQGDEKLILSSKIIEYEKGNAFKRWLLPGWGSTVITVHGDLKNGPLLVGSEKARRTVSIGGAYSIGAWKTIFNSIAEDIVEDIRDKIQKIGS
ncbi:MAG: DUF4410 domain-containing protein [Methylococcaceae bacterium]|nr:DUF4410 domain-containing protein [Methylococcaceae bacterium]